MKTFVTGAAIITLAIGIAGPASAYGKKTIHALQACHDYVWAVPEFSDLPNAAVSVHLDSKDGDERQISWSVTWDDPTVRAAGSCDVRGKEVIGYEDYTK